MPELRVLCFVSTGRIRYLDQYIPPFTHTGSAFIFPDLEVLEFRGGASKELKDEGLYELFQIFVLARKGKITRLRDTSTPESLYYGSVERQYSSTAGPLQSLEPALSFIFIN